ncbi:MAG: hypothetical protein ACUVWR_17560 [Anaerolineae bacterium]
MSSHQSKYPWALLYNLESQRGQQPMPGARRVGRPPNPIPRSRVMLLLTAEEERALQQATALIQEKLLPARVSRSQVVGMAIRLLQMKLEEQGIAEEVEDWPALVSHLADGNHE